MIAKITELDKMVNQLAEESRELFTRFYSFDISTSSLAIPKEMEEWVKGRFGSLERVEHQRIVSVKNKFTGEQSLFNELRLDRPIESKSVIELAELKERKNCTFCNPETHTPADTFGRIKGDYSITAGNIAKYASYHSLIIFTEHNPLEIQREGIADYLRTAEHWFEEASGSRGGTLHKFFLWNCLWRSAASIIHGHMQVTATEERYGKLEVLEKVAAEYQRAFNASYFDDLYRVHKSLGLASENKGERILVYLTPIKEKEIFVISRATKSDEMADTISTLLSSYLQMGVQSFNLAIFPLGAYHIVRLLDRGSLEDRNSDIGALELYAASVISTDPFKLAQVLL
ncbi:MAG: hypothetical protein IBX41_00295 [Methanophagales archaeon]|nr:hypothetical protein [Methanophagales archaeon]